jgi:DNA-binding transcriptional LysR family regulator
MALGRLLKLSFRTADVRKCRMLDWDNLRFLLAVHRAGTVVGAAQRLQVDRATVARRLDALERELRTRLLERTRDGCTLTGAGRDILAAAEEIERKAASVTALVDRGDASLEGPVRITVPEGFAVQLLIRELAALRRTHPGIQIELVATDRIVNLTGREADIAFRGPRPTQPNLVARPPVTCGFGLYASVAYLRERGTPRATWKGHDLVTYDQSMAHYPGYAWLIEHAREARIALRANETLPVLEAARQGMGIALLPCLLGEQDATLRRVPPGVLGSVEMCLVTQRILLKTARVRLVWEAMAQSLTRNAALLRGAPAARGASKRLSQL